MSLGLGQAITVNCFVLIIFDGEYLRNEMLFTVGSLIHNGIKFRNNDGK